VALTVGTLQATITGDARPFTSSMAQVDSTAASSGARLERMWGKVKLAAAAAAAAGAAAVAFGGVKAMANLEQFEVGLTTMLGSGEAARTMLGDLTAFARNTPFQMEGLAANTRQLLGVGIAAEDVIPALTNLGDASAALGLSQEQNDSVVRAFTQSMAKGKVQAEEMMQMAEAGLPVYDLFAKALGVSKGEVLNLASSGQLLAEDVLPKLLDQMGEDYGGGMADQAKTLAGIWSTFQDDVILGLATKLGPLKEFLATALPAAAGVAGDAFTVFGGSLSLLMAVAGPVLALLAQLPSPILTMVAAFAAWQKVGGFITPMTKKVGEAFSALVMPVSSVERAMTPAGASVNRFGAALGALKGVGAAVGLGLIVAMIQDIANNAEEAKTAAASMVAGFDPSATESAAASLDALRAKTAELRTAFENDDMADGIFSFLTDADENFEGYQAQLEATEAQQTRFNSSLSQLADMLGLTEAETRALAESQGVSLSTLGETGQSAGEVAMQLRGMADETTAADASSLAIAESMGVLSDQMATAEEKGNALATILRELAGDQLTQQEAQQAANDAIRGLGEAWAAAAEEAAGAGISLLDAAGNIDTTTAAGSALFDQASAVRDSMGQVASAAFEAAGGFSNLGPAQDAAAAAAQGVYDSFIETASAALGSREAAVALAASLGMVPDVVATAITQPGMSEAQLNLITVAAKLQDLPPNTPVDVTALTAEAQQRLRDLNITVTTLEDGTVVATAETAAAQNELDALTDDRFSTVYVRTVPTAGTAGWEAEGGINSTVRYRAAGAIDRVWPASKAGILPPNRLTAVMGDRKHGMEAFIPLLDRPQYQAILAKAAHMMGRESAPLGTMDRLARLAQVQASRALGMADGGIVGPAPSWPAGGGSGGGRPGIEATINVHPSDRPSARQIRDELAELAWLTGGGKL